MLGILIHVGAVYMGAQIAQLEYADFWRCVVVALVSYVVMFFVGIALFPLILVPLINVFFGAIVLGLGTSIAAKIALGCDWKPAWTVGITAAAANLLFGWILSGCA